MPARKSLAEFYAAMRHYGLLIKDQRNNDMIPDLCFKSKHTDYCAGENVKAEPDHADEGIAD